MRPKLSPLPRAGQLQDSGGAAIGCEAARRHAAPNRAGTAIPTQEDEVEGKAHAEGVDAGAARDQQPQPGFPQMQMGQAKQAGADTEGDGNLEVEHGDDGKAP